MKNDGNNDWFWQVIWAGLTIGFGVIVLKGVITLYDNFQSLVAPYVI